MILLIKLIVTILQVKFLQSINNVLNALDYILIAKHTI